MDDTIVTSAKVKETNSNFGHPVHKLSFYDSAVNLCQTLGREVPQITHWYHGRDRREEAPVLSYLRV